MLSLTPGEKLLKYVPDYVVYDLETTGLSSATDQVVEISAVKVVGGEVAGEYTTLVDPGCPISYSASMVNGITDEMVAGCPDFRQALGDFLDFAGDATLVGHNIHSFDMKFIRRDAEKYWGLTVGNDYVDTLPLARIVIPGLAHYRLVDLAEHYGISSAGAHRALNDCHMNQQVFEHLGREMKKAKDLKLCPRCKRPMIRRNGRYGEFYGCSGYPNCRYTENV